MSPDPLGGPGRADTVVVPPLSRLIALAERDPRRAGRLMRARYGAAPNDPLARLALGWALLRWERTPEAAALLTAAHAALAPDGDLARLCLFGLLCARQLDGEGLSLQPAWEGLAAQAEAAGDRGWAARARCEQVAHLNLLGGYPEARALAAAIAASVSAYGAPADLARQRHVAGVAAAGCGELAAGQSLLEEAALRFAELGRPLAVARVRFELAWIAGRREQLDLARSLLERARAVFQRAELPFRVALCERDLGFLASRRGDLGAAIALTIRARETMAALGRHVLVAACDLNLGVVAHYSGLLDLAEAAYERSHGAYVAAGLRRMALVCRRNQATIRLERGRPTETLALLDRSGPELAAVGDPLEAAEALALRARAIAQRDHAAALPAFAEARAHFAALDNRAAAAECLLEEGLLYLERGELERAAAALDAARLPLEGRPAHLWRAYHGLGRVAEKWGQAEVALAHYTSAGALVAAMRRGLASEHASSAIFAQARRLYRDAIGLAARRGDGASLLTFAEQQRAVALQRQLASAIGRPGAATADLESQRARLRALLDADAAPAALDAALLDYTGALLHSRHRAALPAMLPYTPLDLEQLRLTLRAAYGDDWTILAPIVAGDELLLLTVSPDRIELERETLDAALVELIDRACLPHYRRHTYLELDALRKGVSPTWATLRELGRRLLPRAVRDRIGVDHRLLIVPDGPLHAVPWAALRVDDAWLVERAVVELLPALAAVRQGEARPLSETPALLLACADFGGRAAPLPLAPASLELAAAHWQGPVTRIAGQAATRIALLDLAARDGLRPFGLVHIAAHAHIGGRGLLAHIKLADDDLLADEATGLGLGDCLVVLAACSGAAGEVLPGDEVLGISRALLAAGARSVLGGLWQIYDQGVMHLLDPFYQALAGGADPALALAQAQRAMLMLEAADADQGRLLRSPFVWGGLCVTSIGLARRL